MAAFARRKRRSGVSSAISVTASRNEASRIFAVDKAVSDRSISGLGKASGAVMAIKV